MDGGVVGIEVFAKIEDIKSASKGTQMKVSLSMKLGIEEWTALGSMANDKLVRFRLVRLSEEELAEIMGSADNDAEPEEGQKDLFSEAMTSEEEAEGEDS